MRGLIAELAELGELVLLLPRAELPEFLVLRELDVRRNTLVAPRPGRRRVARGGPAPRAAARAHVVVVVRARRGLAELCPGGGSGAS